MFFITKCKLACGENVKLTKNYDLCNLTTLKDIQFSSQLSYLQKALLYLFLNTISLVKMTKTTKPTTLQTLFSSSSHSSSKYVIFSLLFCSRTSSLDVRRWTVFVNLLTVSDKESKSD